MRVTRQVVTRPVQSVGPHLVMLSQDVRSTRSLFLLPISAVPARPKPGQATLGTLPSWSLPLIHQRTVTEPAALTRRWCKQVAQLWQTDRAKLASFSMNVQRYSQNYKIAFMDHPMGVSGAIQALYLNVLTQRSFVERMSVLFVKRRSSVSEPPCGCLGKTYVIHF